MSVSTFDWHKTILATPSGCDAPREGWQPLLFSHYTAPIQPLWWHHCPCHYAANKRTWRIRLRERGNAREKVWLRQSRREKTEGRAAQRHFHPQSRREWIWICFFSFFLFLLSFVNKNLEHFTLLHSISSLPLRYCLCQSSMQPGSVRTACDALACCVQSIHLVLPCWRSCVSRNLPTFALCLVTKKYFCCRGPKNPLEHSPYV